MANREDMVMLINQNPDLADFDGIPEISKIEDAENLLGIKFPRDYKFFLENYGCGNFGSEEFFGIVKGEPFAIPSVIFATLGMRKIGLPDNYIVIWDAGTDEQFIIDTLQEKNGMAPILTWIGGISLDQQELNVVADSFYDFFIKRASTQLDG